MKTLCYPTILVTLFFSTAVMADDMRGMKMDGHAGMVMDATQQTHKATGTVKAIDAAKGAVTIAHGAVATANWPAMKMTFKVAPEMLGAIKVEQRVEFEFVAQGMAATITKIAGVK